MPRNVPEQVAPRRRPWCLVWSVDERVTAETVAYPGGGLLFFLLGFGPSRCCATKRPISFLGYSGA